MDYDVLGGGGGAAIFDTLVLYSTPNKGIIIIKIEFFL